jgi:chromosomal replication initiator protein
VDVIVDVPFDKEAGSGVNEAQRLWDECAGILRVQMSEPAWLTSFEVARPVGFDGSLLTLAVPSFLAKERIEGRYLSLVRDALGEIGAGHVELVLEIAPSEPEPAWTVAPPTVPAASMPSGDARVEDINPRYTFDTFVIGASNRFAHAAALAVAETPARK